MSVLPFSEMFLDDGIATFDFARDEPGCPEAERQASGAANGRSAAEAIGGRLQANVRLVTPFHGCATGRNCTVLPGCLRSRPGSSSLEGHDVVLQALAFHGLLDQVLYPLA